MIGCVQAVRSVAVVWAAVLAVSTVALPGPAGATSDVELQSAVFRAKPAVVMIGIRAEATASVQCGAAAPVTVKPRPIAWIGSGAIVHPDGWIATNGHVVQPFHEKNDDALAGELLEAAVGSACEAALSALPADARAREIKALASDPGNRAGLALSKTLTVGLSNGRMYPAQVKSYSPPAYVEVARTTDAAGAVRREFGRDVAILKIEARDLPVVRLARYSTNLHLGQELFVIGFPGVVATHELLSAASRYEPSVTVGRVSGFKQDVGGQRVIQTDAAIIQGNSGGPVFDDRGDVVGAATFTSTQGDQVVPGFNFLIPVETLREAAAKAGVAPTADSAFSRLWNHGVDLYIRDLHYRAYRNMSAASAIHPGFPDVERVKEDCQIKHAEQGYLHREEVQWALTAVAVVLAAAAAWFGGRRAAAAVRDQVRRIVREELDRRPT